MTTLDPETLALKVAIALNQAYSGKAEAIANRAKDLPQLVLQVGLVHALAFYMSKIESEDSYKKLYEYLRGHTELQSGSSISVNDVARILRQEASGEGKGYTPLLAIATIFISNEATNISECRSLDSLKNIATCLLKLKDSKEIMLLEKRLLSYLVITKRLLEAFYGE